MEYEKLSDWIADLIDNWYNANHKEFSEMERFVDTIKSFAGNNNKTRIQHDLLHLMGRIKSHTSYYESHGVEKWRELVNKKKPLT
jgi:hypothetical protein